MLPTFKANRDDIKNRLVKIGESLIKANELVLESLEDCDMERFSEARSHIKNIRSKTDDIDNAIIKVLALYTPEARDLRQIVAYLKIANELSRACSNTRSFIRDFSDVCTKVDNTKIKEYTIPMQTSILKATRISVAMMSVDDVDELQEMYEEVLIEENKADDLYEMIERNLSKEAKDVDNFEKFYTMLKALRKSEKIASRAISVANLLLYIKVGGSLHR